LRRGPRLTFGLLEKIIIHKGKAIKILSNVGSLENEIRVEKGKKTYKTPSDSW